jgi:hypothetical protein
VIIDKSHSVQLSPDDSSLELPTSPGIRVAERTEQLYMSIFQPNLTLSYWDFSGQLQFSAAHEFLLSNRQAVNVIVFDASEDIDLQMHRVMYWLRCVVALASRHVRFIIVGTKVDLIRGEWPQVLQKLQVIESKLQRAINLVYSSSAVSVKFVTAVSSHPQFKLLRGKLKDTLDSLCKSIFEGHIMHLKQLRFPQQFKDMMLSVQKVIAMFSAEFPVINIATIDHDDVKFGELRNAHRNAHKLMALRALHDMGVVLFCEIGGPDDKRAFICWNMTVVTQGMAGFSDPDIFPPARRGCERGVFESILLHECNDLCR